MRNPAILHTSDKEGYRLIELMITDVMCVQRVRNTVLGKVQGVTTITYRMKEPGNLKELIRKQLVTDNAWSRIFESTTKRNQRGS